jgi:hypothetical protein
VSCIDVGDCSVATDVCDPHTHTCVPGECDGVSLNCADVTDVCLLQTDGATTGACYDGCTLFGSPSCAAQQTCLPLDLGDNAGACFGVGPGALGASCAPTSLSTGCTTGALCLDDGGATPVCRKECNYFTGGSGCGASLRCIIGDVCSSTVADTAALNATCSASAAELDFCGKNASELQGVCLDTGDVLFTCFKFCEIGGNDCASIVGSTCTSVSSTDPTIGVCSG